MKIHLESGVGQNLIRAYAPGVITINDVAHRHSLVLTPERVLEWPPAGFDDLLAAHFESIAELRPEVVLLGTGARLRFPAPRLTRSLVEANIGLEVMDTGAACRTYNILMSDGRRVVAALLMIEG
ncbi:MAG: Mth938-like domain-containing protein [Gammaproteobacteria bacterium]|nr:Mth938-like domain-containing protein [Gammaproteobacteria bacterium]MDH5486712.1 Mth938-like domain-containing protein [Gammaproteobacteria bacterium]